MTQTHYDTIIIGAEQKDLTPSPSPYGRGDVSRKNKAPAFQQGLVVIDYAGTAMYSADAVASGIGSLSSINPWMCISTASCMLRSVSSRVLPVATQPGKSGE